MITERFINFLKANLTDFLEKLEAFEKDYKNNKNSWTLESFLNDIFGNPTQRKQFEDAYDKYQNIHGEEKKDPRGGNDPFEKFNYYYDKYEQQEHKQDQQFKDFYSRYKQRKQGFNYGRSQQQDSPELKYYKVLEVKPSATFDEIRKSYKRLMMQYHPDKFSGDEEKQKNAQKIAQKINEAYAYFKKKFGK